MRSQRCRQRIRTLQDRAERGLAPVQILQRPSFCDERTRGANDVREGFEACQRQPAQRSEQDPLAPVQILQGLTWQSYYIAAGIGEIDDFLKDNEAAKEAIIESHPEFCFRGLLGHQLSYSKKSA